jgi:hypothetical protein
LVDALVFYRSWLTATLNLAIVQHPIRRNRKLRDRGQQSLRIFMTGLPVDIIGQSLLNDFTLEHDRTSVAQVSHDG